MASGGEVEVIAMPWAHDVALFAEAQPGAFLIRRDYFLDLVKNLALADGTACMRTDILVGEHFAAGAKNPDFDLIEGENAVIAVGDIGQFRH
jgi:hypothetical protein